MKDFNVELDVTEQKGKFNSFCKSNTDSDKLFVLVDDTQLRTFDLRTKKLGESLGKVGPLSERHWYKTILTDSQDKYLFMMTDMKVITRFDLATFESKTIETDGKYFESFSMHFEGTKSRLLVNYMLPPGSGDSHATVLVYDCTTLKDITAEFPLRYNEKVHKGLFTSIQNSPDGRYQALGWHAVVYVFTRDQNLWAKLHMGNS